MHTLGQLIGELESYAPTYLAEKWDNVGLLIGSRKQSVNKVLCALDINLGVIEEAIAKQVDCIITHHPFIFKPLARIDFDTPRGEMIRLLIQHNIAVYSMHTNWDIASGGINDILSNLLGLKEAKPLVVTHTEVVRKLAIYTPMEAAEAVRAVLMEANKCKIGNYKGCTFMLEGEGSFIPLEGSNPYIGAIGKCELVREVKIECIAFEKDIHTIMEEVAKVHPYEEIAYDIYKLQHIKHVEGIGRHGECSEISQEELINKVKEIFKVPYVRVIGEATELIKNIAICSGSGSEFIDQAARTSQVYITGDVKFHEAQYALEQGLIILDVGHYASENIAMTYLKDHLTKQFQSLEIYASEIDGEVFKII